MTVDEWEEGGCTRRGKGGGVGHADEPHRRHQTKNAGATPAQHTRAGAQVGLRCHPPLTPGPSTWSSSLPPTPPPPPRQRRAPRLAAPPPPPQAYPAAGRRGSSDCPTHARHAPSARPAGERGGTPHHHHPVDRGRQAASGAGAGGMCKLARVGGGGRGASRLLLRLIRNEDPAVAVTGRRDGGWRGGGGVRGGSALGRVPTLTARLFQHLTPQIYASSA